MPDGEQTRDQLLEVVESLRRELDTVRRSDTAAHDCPDPDEISYRELVQSANTIVLRWDLQGRVTFLNDYGLEFFDFTADELVGRSVIGTIVPETETSGRDLVQMIDELLHHPDRYVNNENENMRRSGERVWVTWRNRVLRDEVGKVRELLSIGIDSTERKRADEALRQSEWRYRALFQSTPIAMVERDATRLKAHVDALHAAGVRDIDAYLQEHPDDVTACLHLVKVTDMNAAATELFETDDPAHLDSFAYIAGNAGFTALVRTIVSELATAKLASQQREGIIRTAQGHERNVLARTTIVPGADSQTLRILTALIDITERKQAEEALRASEERFRFLSVHDNLTGLFNTRYLYQALGDLLALEGATCSVIFMDLDRFKSVVDTYGHLNGSQAIQEVAQTIRACISEPAFAVAYAGDEFVIVLPGTEKEHAVETARDVQARIGARVFLADAGYAVRLSASLGVATYPDDAANMKDLLVVADQALFDAKQRGRSAIVVVGAAVQQRVIPIP